MVAMVNNHGYNTHILIYYILGERARYISYIGEEEEILLCTMLDLSVLHYCLCLDLRIFSHGNLSCHGYISVMMFTAKMLYTHCEDK